MKNKEATQKPVQAFSGNAEDLFPHEIERLFVPNVVLVDKDSLCTYDRIALPHRTYILIAERGMGKTYILNLLMQKMDDRGDYTVLISALSSMATDTYRNLLEAYPDAEKQILWQLAIFEAMGIELLSPLKRVFPLFFDSGAQLLVEYFKKYHPIQLENAIHYWRDQVEQGKKSGPLTEVLLSIEAAWAKITANVKAGKPPELPPPSAMERKITVERWVWSALQRLRKTSYAYEKNYLNNIMVRNLPEVRSIYIIADGLDQDRPMSKDDLVALVLALKELNKTAKKHLGDSIMNFKIIMALRAITYDYSLKDCIPDLTHLRGNIERLSWDDEALKQLMARYIFVHSDKEFPEGITVSQVLEMVFPLEPIAYFGRIFQSGVDFFLEYTEKRPREIIYLWQTCSKEAGQDDKPYSTLLSPQHIITGLKKYSTGDLPEDIGAEYELEFPGIRFLLRAFSDNKGLITRIVSKHVLKKIISEYINSIADEQRPKWVASSSNQVLRYLFQIGIFGLPSGNIDLHDNWPKVSYVKDNPDRSIDDVEFVVIRPAFWNFMTNIKSETLRRRQYALSLFKELFFHTYTLENQLDEESPGATLEMVLACFFSIGAMVKTYNGFPEHRDWEILLNVNRGLDLVWNKLISTPFCPYSGDGRKLALEAYSGIISPLSIQVKPTYDDPRTEYYTKDEFEKNISESSEYQTAMKSMSRWLSGRKRKHDRRNIERFRDQLMGNEGSFHPILGRAIDETEGLL